MTLLVPSPWLHCIAMLFRYMFWYVNILFDLFKLILMMCITVADFIFAFSPITPAAPTVRSQVRSFISGLWTSLLVYTQFILPAQVDGIDLSFRYFTFLTTCSSQYSAMARGIHQRSVDLISGANLFFLFYFNQYKWSVLPLQFLFSVFLPSWLPQSPWSSQCSTIADSIS